MMASLRDVANDNGNGNDCETDSIIANDTETSKSDDILDIQPQTINLAATTAHVPEWQPKVTLWSWISGAGATLLPPNQPRNTNNVPLTIAPPTRKRSSSGALETAQVCSSRPNHPLTFIQLSAANSVTSLTPPLTENQQIHAGKAGTLYSIFDMLYKQTDDTILLKECNRAADLRWEIGELLACVNHAFTHDMTLSACNTVKCSPLLAVFLHMLMNHGTLGCQCSTPEMASNAAEVLASKWMRTEEGSNGTILDVQSMSYAYASYLVSKMAVLRKHNGLLEGNFSIGRFLFTSSVESIDRIRRYENENVLAQLLSIDTANDLRSLLESAISTMDVLESVADGIDNVTRSLVSYALAMEVFFLSKILHDDVRLSQIIADAMAQIRRLSNCGILRSTLGLDRLDLSPILHSIGPNQSLDLHHATPDSRAWPPTLHNDAVCTFSSFDALHCALGSIIKNTS
jgi:hypothetical protein